MGKSTFTGEKKNAVNKNHQLHFEIIIPHYAHYYCAELLRNLEVEIAINEAKSNNETNVSHKAIHLLHYTLWQIASGFKGIT